MSPEDRRRALGDVQRFFALAARKLAIPAGVGSPSAPNPDGVTHQRAVDALQALEREAGERP